MDVKQVTVTVKRTQSLPGYCNVSHSLSVTAELDEVENYLLAQHDLRYEIEQEVNDAIDVALEQAGQPAIYSPDPRYDLIQWRNADMLFIVPHTDSLDLPGDLPGKWSHYATCGDEIYSNQRLPNLRMMCGNLPQEIRELPTHELREWVQAYFKMPGLWTVITVDAYVGEQRWKYLGKIAVPGSVYVLLSDEENEDLEIALLSGKSVNILTGDLSTDIQIIETLDEARAWIQSKLENSDDHQE